MGRASTRRRSTYNTKHLIAMPASAVRHPKRSGKNAAPGYRECGGNMQKRVTAKVSHA